MDEYEVRSYKVMRMYKIIADNLVTYLKHSGMIDPHPSKEFILELIKIAVSLEDSGKEKKEMCYYWCTDINGSIMPCSSTTDIDLNKWINTTGYFDDYYFNVI